MSNTSGSPATTTAKMRTSHPTRTPIGEICELAYGAALPERLRLGGKTAVYGSNGIVGWHKDALTKQPTIIIGRKGSVGEVHLSTAPCWPIDTTYYVEAQPEKFDIRWLTWHLKALRLSELHRSTAIPGLRREDVHRLAIYFPSLDEQRRIVAMLDRQMALTERASAFARQQKGLIDDFVGATLREAFHSIVPLSIDPNEAERPPTNWRWARLVDVARLESGHTPSRRHPDWWGGKIPWLALPDIRALHGTVAMTTTENTNRIGIANSSARVLPKDTVALSRTASVGFVTIMGRPMATSQDFVNWVCGPALEPWFLLYALMASRNRLLSLSSGAIHKTIYMPTVEAFHVCMPPIDTQRIFVKKIRERLALNERMRQRAAEEAEAIAAIPQIILHQAFGEAA